MSNFLTRNWGLILQQAWTMYLKAELSTMKVGEIMDFMAMAILSNKKGKFANTSIKVYVLQGPSVAMSISVLNAENLAMVSISATGKLLRVETNKMQGNHQIWELSQELLSDFEVSVSRVN